MPIKIIPRGKPMPTRAIAALILGNPGIGKTTLANTSADPILLAFDVKGAKRSLNRPDVVAIGAWKEIEDLTKEDLKPYKTVIIDTVGHCLDALARDIMEREPKMGNAGQLSLQGYGRLKGRFKKWLDTMQSHGINVVLVAHATEEKHGDEVKLRLDATGASKEEVYKEADLMGRMTIKGKHRHIDWDPSESGFGKNPAGLPAESVPNVSVNDHYMADCIKGTIDHLSQAGVAAAQEEERLRALRDHYELTLKTPADFTERARAMKEAEAPFADRGVLLSVATDRGYALDKQAITFTDPKTEAEAAAQAAAQPEQGGEGQQAQVESPF